ncbi:hypothetical protein PTTG_28135 [Puccinia triticina 1-1 BBBD Race 1]|uniref:GCM domain-containing protein n=1 Tax=Puccinia triticina (isolate 1-1 / race 1 (BBBD)) TaxID=630390 RepID=A0A180GEB6_PUCT1|nr:hypothetical protein PTTG_28135 [Puccinia triticina 1-1 BBBD Race 1]
MAQPFFVKGADQVVVNFGSVGFTKTTGVEKRGKGTWKIQRTYCLGVLVCNIDTCHEPKCPGAAGRCPGKVTWEACNGTALRFDFHIPSGWALLRHRGLHDHPWPESKKPDPLARADLKAEIVKNPSAGAFKLKMGQPSTLDDPITSVTEIHGSFINADRLRYYRRLMLRELNIVPDKLGAGVGDKFMMDLFQWNARGLLIISSGFQTECEHFTFQTKWMAERLLARDENNEVYQGGLISDVTYRFFENGYLLTTSMFCEQTARWIPAQISWIRGLSVNYYKLHFSALLRQFVRPDITPSERDLMVRQVVDFSLAQTEGFKAAYMDVFACTDPMRAAKMIKGCHQHFRAQVTRVRRNRSILSADQDADFQKKCMALLDPIEEGGLTHEEKLDELRRLFPKTKRWLDWWTMSDIQSMLFPSRRPMLDDHPDGEDGLPDTTNAIESMHRVYYMISSGKKCLIVGMVELLGFISVLEEEYNAVMCGVSVEYGSQTKMQRKFINDGRPPDTTAGLLDGPEPSIKKKNAGRPKNSLNVEPEEPHLKNRCWMSAALESLFALYNPLWLRDSKGKGATLFYHLAMHFGSRTTFNLTKIGRIRTVLTNAQTKLFNMCNERHQARFQPGAFASCDFFIELLLDPKLNPTKALTGLFEVVEHRDFACRSAEPCLVPQIRSLTPIKIELKNFLENGLNPSDVSGLILLWTTTGLSKTPGLVCRCDSIKASSEQKPKPRGRPKKVKDLSPAISVKSQRPEDTNLPPQHLYFFMEVTQPSDPIERERYMGAMDWPYQITISGVKFTLFSRGYWNGCHYWCKNDGNARLVNTDMSSIGGRHPFTSWLFYTRVWTSEEEEHVKSAIAKISNANPNAEGYVVDEFDISDSSDVDDASEEAQDRKDSAGESDSSDGEEDLSDSSAGSSPESDSEEAKAVRTASIPNIKVPVSTADISASPKSQSNPQPNNQSH